MNENVCRICCEHTGTLSIFTYNDGIQISAKIMHCCVNLNITEEDGLPSHICSKCVEELSFSYQFVIKCEAADKKLRSANNALIEQEHEVKLKVEVKVENEELEINYHDEFDSYVPSEPEEEKVEKKPRNKRKSGRQKCKFCDRVCNNPSTMIIHMRSHTNEKPYNCPLCDKKYKDSGGMKRHYERNHVKEQRERKYVCENCGKRFYSKNDCSIHMRTHTGETPFPCQLCPKRFTQIGALLRHQQRHKGERTHMCPVCGKKFCTKEDLRRHSEVHSNEKNFTCHICSAPFKYKNNLKKHIKLHSQQSSFICNYCGRAFNVKGNLTLHINRQHSAQSGYCNECSKYVPNIEVHMWRHTGKRPLKCELCSSTFFEKKALNHHINYRHKNIDKYKCTVDGCSLTFPSQPMLNYHVAKLHGSTIPFPCDRCSRGFYRKNDLARHKIGTHKEKLEI